MTKRSIKYATGWVLLLALVAATASVLVPAPSADAADCGGWAGGMSSEWVATAAAQARTAVGDCADGYICLQWCTISCGEAIPENTFGCFPAN